MGRMSVLYQRRRLRAGGSGFTLFELIVVICIVSVVAALLLNRLRVYKEAAERASMLQTAAAIKSALQMRVAAYLINGRDGDIEAVRSDNPVTWLQEKPDNYAGEYFADAYARVSPGSWYFDQARKELIYVVDLGANFAAGADGRKWVRYKVTIEYELMPQREGPPRTVLTAVNFSPVVPYRWF